jgi:hypothetical protein
LLRLPFAATVDSHMSGPTRTAGRRLLVSVALAAFLCLGGSAAAHGPGLAGKASERTLRALETRLLGDAHATEHARQRKITRRAAARWRRMSPSQRRSARAEERSAKVAGDPGPPSEVGAWDAAFPLPVHGIHAALLPTGKVILWAYPFGPETGRANEGRSFVWDPARGTGADAFTDVPPPQMDVDGDGDTEPAPIYCSGQSFLADGTLFVTGGNLEWPTDFTTQDFRGLSAAFTFDPWSERWTRQPSMRHGRWYPTQTLLPDGRTVVVAGLDEQDPKGRDNPDLEVFSPGSGGMGSFELKPSGSRRMGLYPHMFVVPDGRVLMGGPNAGDSAFLDPTTFTWRDLPNLSHQRLGATGLLRPGGPEGSTRVTLFGGYDKNDGQPDHAATATSETLDARAGSPAWTADEPWNVARSYANTVQLPDGSTVTVGGGAGSTQSRGVRAQYDDHRERQVELQDPATGRWSLGPAQAEDRGYHSIALLLPDGRVLSAGDDAHPVNSADTAEIYSPPYLFKGSRPEIASAPSAVRAGTTFEVGTPGGDVGRAVLMAPGAITHSTDMNQRHVELRILGRHAGGLTVAAPPDLRVAPPGPYMLFLLDDRGVPSVARWVRIEPGQADLPPGGGDGPPPYYTDRTRPVARVSLSRASVRRLLKDRRIKVTAYMNEPGTGSLSAAMPAVRKGARKSRKLLNVAATTTRFTRPGLRTVKLKLTRTGRRNLARARSHRVVVTLLARDEAGNETKTTARRTFR